MSRIGKKPIPIPAGVTVKIHAGAVEVQGPKGTLRQRVPTEVAFDVADGHIRARTVREDAALGKFHGLARTLVANAVQGVTQGFKRELDIVGIGYRGEVRGKQVVFALGYSHPVVFDVPDGIEIANRQADARHRDGCRPPEGGAGRGRYPVASQARPVQAEGRPVHG